MSDEKTSLTAALRHLVEQERRTPSEHATPGELTAYHEGTLPPPIEARVREHLAHCKLCSDLLLDLAGFADLPPPPSVPELTDAEVEEDWQALRARMGEGETEKPRDLKPPGEVVPIRPAKAVEVVERRRDFSPWKVAAAILVAAVALFVSVRILKPSPERVAIVELSDGDRLRGSTEEEPPRITSSQRPKFKFHIFDSYPSYRGEIVAGRTVVWQTTFSADHVSTQPDSDLKEISVLGPEKTLEPGRYESRLFGIGADGPKRLGSLEFEVDAP